ncbi:hypothetical protein [Sutcliffiella deserti]|uniref:hypothetical protein n=1 Tax=Sutcliffiella deserti TaxID=2875501 RepID=UPI001CBA7D94|nr:hypothetical protein [Sutcliffiella deserti]
MDAIYIFTIAAVIACFGIAFILRSSLEKISLEPGNLGQIQSKLFMLVAFIEAFPIVFIVFGFMLLADSTADTTIPLIIVVISVLVNGILNFMKRNELVTAQPELRNILNSLFRVGTALMLAIPIVAIVAMFVR